MRPSATTDGPVRCLRFEDVAPGLPYHAALHVTEAAGARGYRVTEHTHDFYEMLLVLAGDGAHGVNGVGTELAAGDLVLLRPGDRHYIRFHTGRFLHYVNIAARADLWRGFHDLAGVGADLAAPVFRSLAGSPTGGARDECADAFRRALVRFQEPGVSPPSLRTEMCRLLATVAPWLLGGDEREGGDAADLPGDAPPWLRSACRLLRRDPDALRRGRPAFVAAAGVSPTHLARVLRAATGETPTGYVNRLRLERAALLLTTTAMPILEVAGDCGFEQAGYFYRRFRAHFGTTPHAYRVAAARRVAPAPDSSLRRRGRPSPPCRSG